MPAPQPRAPRLLHVDTAYTLQEARDRRNVDFFRGRDASGLFGRVWSVHPIADAAGRPGGRIDVARLSGRHGVIEGKAELCRVPRYLKPINFLVSQFALYRLLVRLVKRQRIDVVVGVDPFVSGVLALAVARRTRRPLVIRVSGNPDDLYEAAGALAHPRLLPWHWLQKAFERFVLPRADLVSAINRNNLDYAIANGARRHTGIIPISGHLERMHWIEPQRRPAADDLLRKWDIPGDAALLIYVGRLILLKHPEDAVRAMAKVISQRPGTIGIMAGDGDMRPALEQLAHELGAADSIRFVGRIDQESLWRVLPRCVLLSPSAGQMALLEGALAGAPIVAYDRDFQPEFIEDGEDGYIVPFRDWRAMADKAAEILADRGKFERLSSRIRRKAADYLDPERIRAVEQETFGKVLNGRSEPGTRT